MRSPSSANQKVNLANPDINLATPDKSNPEPHLELIILTEGPEDRKEFPEPRSSRVPAKPTLRAATAPGPKETLLANAAKEFLRARRYKEALQKFEKVLTLAPDPSSGAGLVHCLRRLGRLEEARGRLAEIKAAFPDDLCLEEEAGWLRVATDLEPILQQGMINNAALLAEEIISSSDSASLNKHVSFRIIRLAKQKKNYALMGYFCELIDPATLSQKEPRGENNAWSELARWTGARILSFLHTGGSEQALVLARGAAHRFSNQRRMFMRWQAQALIGLEQREEALGIYLELCGDTTKKTDWWLLKEQGQLLQELGRTEEALFILCRSALGCGKREMGVQLFEVLASCALDAGHQKLACVTADLAVQIRQRCQWRVSETLCEILSSVGPIETQTEEERARRCRAMWREVVTPGLGETKGKIRTEQPLNEVSADGRRGPLEGRLLRPDSSCPFCFILYAKERIFCLAADLPEGAADGVRVRFHVERSFDKKHQKKSWRAIHVELFELLAQQTTPSNTTAEENSIGPDPVGEVS